MELAGKEREVLQALAAGAVLWREARGCYVDGYGKVDWETFDDMLEKGLIEWDASESLGFFRQAFVITDGGREVSEMRGYRH